MEEDSELEPNWTDKYDSLYFPNMQKTHSGSFYIIKNYEDQVMLSTCVAADLDSRKTEKEAVFSG
jgi:hypothetical protein